MYKERTLTRASLGLLVLSLILGVVIGISTLNAYAMGETDIQIDCADWECFPLQECFIMTNGTAPNMCCHDWCCSGGHCWCDEAYSCKYDCLDC
jgi:hypothetical protein